MKREKARRGNGRYEGTTLSMRKGWPIAPLAVSSVLALILAGFLISGLTGLSIRDGLRMVKGRWTGYRNPGGSAWLSLHRSGPDAWGFFEWGDERLYGLFDGSWKELTGKGMALAPAGKEGWLLNIRKGLLPGRISVTLARPGGEGKTLSMRQERGRGLRLSSFSGNFGPTGELPGRMQSLYMPTSIRAMPGLPGSSHFHVDALGPGAEGPGNPFDRRLRRGRNESAYAVALWGNFRKDWEASSKERPSLTASLAERQYFVSDVQGLISVLTERYVYSGGAHGITTMMCELFDPAGGEPVEADRLFISGWEPLVEKLLREEALRLSGNPYGDLRASGFFEDRIPATRSIFLGHSGVGFHYDRYELAPYAQGDFLFMLPWSALAGVLSQ